MLAVRDIDLYYGASQALRNVSLFAKKGAVTCVLGRNGVGKSSLLRAIVGQQISVAAAQSVWNKFSGVALEIIPEKILQLKPTQLRACGLSDRKTEYIVDLARRFVKPWRLRATGQDFQAALSWDQVKRFKDRHDIPLILKGIATGEDADIACDLGVDGVYVSNHGGRQLNHGRGSIEVLPEVVQAVAGRSTIIVDGGFMRGTDVIKAIALGAHVVGLGRLTCIGLAAAGEAGLVRVLELLEDEIRIAMGLLGVHSLDMLDPSYVHPATPVSIPHVTSAFPLLDLDDRRY